MTTRFATLADALVPQLRDQWDEACRKTERTDGYAPDVAELAAERLISEAAEPSTPLEQALQAELWAQDVLCMATEAKRRAQESERLDRGIAVLEANLAEWRIG